MKILIFVALVLCNFDFITNDCNHERSDVYTVNMGEDIRIPSGCTEEEEIQTIHWFFQRNDISRSIRPEENVTSKRDPETGDLLLKNVIKESNGTYHFRVRYANSETIDRSEKIPVIVKWEDKYTTVTLFSPQDDKDMELGVEVKIVCDFDMNPKATKIGWFRNGKELSNSNNIVVQYDRLTIKQLAPENLGVYVCRVDNIFEERPFILDVPNGLTTVNNLESSTLCPLIVKEGDTFWVHFRDQGGTFLLNGNKKLFNNLEDGYTVFSKNGSVYVSEADRSLKSIDLISAKSGHPHNCPINVTYLDPPTLQPDVMYFGGGAITKTTYICTAGSANPPPTLYNWFQGNHPVKEKGTQIDEPSVTRVTNGVVLNLPASYKPTRGNDFACRVGNVDRTMTVSLKTIFVDFHPAEKTYFDIKEGETLRVQCMASDSDVNLFTFQWEPFAENDADAKSMIDRAQKSSNGNVLTLKNASIYDSVKITCAGFGKLEQISSFTVSNSITIKVSKKFKFLIPLNVRESKTFVHYLKTGETNTIPCQAEGPADKSKPTITWSFLRRSTNSSSAVKSDGTFFPAGVYISPNVTDTKDLVFNQASAAQNGIYQCLAKLDSEELSLTFDVKVIDDIALSIKTEPVDQTVEKGGRVQFSCEPKLLDSDDQPDTSWFVQFPGSAPRLVEQLLREQLQQEETQLQTSNKNNSENTDYEPKQPRMKILNSTVLVIDDVQPLDQGHYWCIFNRTSNYGKPDLKPTRRARLKVAASSGDQSMRTILIAVACAVGYILFMLALTIYCRRKRLASRNRQLGAPNGDEKAMAGVPDGANEPLVNANGRPSPTRELMPLQRRNLNVEKLQFPRQELQTTSLLGRGEYGDVFLAVAQGLHLNDSSVPRSTAGSASSSPTPAAGEQLVMVKSLLQKEKHLHEKFQVEMEQYAQLRCVNVTRLLGVCTETEPLYMIFEYTEWGDLKRFLMSTKGHSGLPQAPAIELTHKLHIAYQALKGLEYVANHKLVHKDIAARNFLLTADLGVKLSNASLCKDLYRSEYYEYHNALIPLRWMPLEAIYDESFTQMSDAYSFGVTLWEIFSLGVLPYQELTNEEVLKRMTVGELKLSPPEDCPPQVANIMMKCWEECAINRPSFSQMLTILTSINVDSNC